MLEKLKINRKLLKELDFSIIIVAILIVSFGIMNIYSATYLKSGAHVARSQFIWLIIGLLIIYFILTVDYSIIEGYANIFYWFSVFLLVLNDTPFFKHTVNGASSWMSIGGFTFQPSELAKLGIILIISKKLDEMEGNINTPKNFFTLVLYAAIPMVLIVIQPDMGMTMVCFFIVLGMFFMAGLDLRVIFGGLAGASALVGVVMTTSIMPAYWKSRLFSFLDPQADELGSGLQLSESLKGIGSGGLFGKGFLKGTQVAGGFIPENQTDFIFSVVGEEWGLIGGLVLLTLYGILLYRFIKIARNSKDIFGRMLCIGIISLYMFSIFENIGMTIGLAPITGITLQLMSYGGSSMLTSFIGIALILNVGMRKKKINF